MYYWCTIPKVVDAIQIKFSNRQTLRETIRMCGSEMSLEDEEKYIDKSFKKDEDGNLFFLLKNCYNNNLLAVYDNMYVSKYENIFNREITIEVVSEDTFNMYTKKLSDYIKELS